MLTTATILMSLGTDPANARYVPSDRADATGISFAKSFDEGSALAGETQVADGKELKNAAGSESAVQAKNVSVVAILAGVKVKADVSAGDKLQNESHGANSLTSLRNAKGSSIPGGVVVTATGGRLSHGERSNEGTSTAIQAEMPDDQLLSGKTKDVPQKSAPGVIDGGKTDDTDVAASVTPSIPNDDVKPAIQKQKEMLVSDKNQETVPIKKVADGHDGVVKTDKATKPEEKIAVMAASAAGVGAQAVIAGPVMVLPVDKQQYGLNAAQDNDQLLSGPSVVAGGSVGTTPVIDGKAGKKSVGAGKTDGDNMKGVVSVLGDDPASKKSGTDATSMATSAPKTVDGDNAKAQSMVAAVATAGLTHAELGVPGITFGGIPGGAAAHVVTARTSAAESNSHAAIVQAGSGAVDAAGPIDVTHKTLMATPTSLEVGIANGTHGWLKIRAEMTGGGVVNASLSTATASGQEMLHRELPSLTAYLQSERVAVNTVVVQPAGTPGADARELAGGVNSDGREQAQQSGGQGGENRQETASAVPDHLGKERLYNGLNGVGGDELLSSETYVGGGSWLNVRA